MARNDGDSSSTVDVRFFASLVEATGASRARIPVTPTDTVEDLWSRLAERYPGLKDLRYRPLVACDLDYADWSRSLEGVKEVAFLPPVSGG